MNNWKTPGLVDIRQGALLEVMDIVIRCLVAVPTTLPLEQTLNDAQSCCSCSASSSQTMNFVQGRI